MLMAVSRQLTLRQNRDFLMKIGLLQCDHVSEQYRDILGGDYPDLFTKLFAEHAPEIELVTYDVCHGELPTIIDECEGYLTTGSKYSVYDDIEWIHQLSAFVQQLHEHQHKLVGICFGHQMIAHALGGKVAKSERGWGIGSKPVEIQKTKSWMTPDLTSYKLLLSHQDQVEALPLEAEVLGGNEHCPASIMTVGEHFMSIQAHPEFTRDYSQVLMLSRLERIGRDVVEAAQATLEQVTDEAAITQWISAFFSETDA